MLSLRSAACISRRKWNFLGIFKTIRMFSNVDISVQPESGLVDENLRISVSGLKPFERITFLSTVRNRGKTYAASANYVANSKGCILNDRDPSFGGTFFGYEPEGLIWSMIPLKESLSRRFLVENVSEPLNFQLKLFRDVLSVQEATYQEPDAEAAFQRWYKAPNVSRLKIRGSRIRGTFFLPEGNGPFIPVIDIMGAGDLLPENRAALLASRGFAVLALAHFGYEDLPKLPGLVSLDYFKEAIDWVLGMVDSEGVSIISSSVGSTYAFAMAEAYSVVQAVVAINGYNRPVTLYPTDSKNWLFGREPIHYDQKLARKNKQGLLTTLDLSSRAIRSEDTFQIQNSKARYLLLAGELDEAVSPLWTKTMEETLKKHGHPDFEAVIYPGAGHIFEPPHYPFSDRAPYSFVKGLFFYYGGEPYLQARAQADAWDRILKFLKKDMHAEKFAKSREKIAQVQL